jgi:predicted phage tail protein
MESVVKIKNVGRGEEIFRYVTGIILIISSFFISGGFRWVLGLIGVALVLTAIFGY